jgi:hypothetical protein
MDSHHAIKDSAVVDFASRNPASGALYSTLHLMESKALVTAVKESTESELTTGEEHQCDGLPPARS